jgi:hypothetical protein
MCSEAVWLVATVDISRCDFSSLGGTPCSQPRDGGYHTLVYPELAMTRQNLTDLTYLAVQRGATRAKTLAHEIDVGFEFEKQVGVPYRHAQFVS